MARPSNSALRREQIAEGLLRVMARKGYDSASISDIAGAARLAPGLVHYHFRNKREVLLAALERLGARHGARLDRALAEAGADPGRRLAAFVDAHLSRAAADPVALACWVTASGEALRDTVVRHAYRAIVDGAARRLRAILADGTRAGAFACRPAETAAAILAAIEGCFVLAAAAPGTIPRDSAARSVKRMAAALVKASAG